MAPFSNKNTDTPSEGISVKELKYSCWHQYIAVIQTLTTLNVQYYFIIIYLSFLKLLHTFHKLESQKIPFFMYICKCSSRLKSYGFVADTFWFYSCHTRFATRCVSKHSSFCAVIVVVFRILLVVRFVDFIHSPGKTSVFKCVFFVCSCFSYKLLIMFLFLFCTLYYYRMIYLMWQLL